MDVERAQTRSAEQTHSLPSGVRVRMCGKADPARPWECFGSGDSWVVRRERRGDSASFEHYRGGRPHALVLNAEDAIALAGLLNANVSRRPPRSTPTGWY